MVLYYESNKDKLHNQLQRLLRRSYYGQVQPIHTNKATSCPAGLGEMYHEANDNWEQCDIIWDHHVEAHQQFKEASLQHQHAAQKLAYFESVQAQRDEHTNLGQISQKLQKVTTILRYVPEPHVQTVAAAIDQVSSVLDFVNKVWCLVDVAQAKLTLIQMSNVMEEFKLKAEDATHDVINIDEMSKAKEEQVLREEWTFTAALAKAVRPLPSWGESDWQRFAALLLPDRPTVEQINLASNMVNHADLAEVFEQEVLREWIARRDFSLSRLQKHQALSKRELKLLQTTHDEEDIKLQGIRKKLTQKRTLLDAATRKQALAKKCIEAFLQSIGEVALIDEIHLEQQRMYFVANMRELEGMTFQIERIMQEIEQLVDNEKSQLVASMRAAHALFVQQKIQKRISTRLKKCADADVNALRVHWRTEDDVEGQYVNWTLPSGEDEEEDSKSQLDGSGSAREPVKLLLEQEAKGRSKWYYTQQQIKSVSKESQQNSRQPKREVESIFLSEKVEAVDPISSNVVDELKAETLQHFKVSLIAPSLRSEEEYERWQLRQEIDANFHRANGISRILQLQQLEDQSVGTDRSASGPGSVISWMTSSWSKPLPAASSLSRFTMASAASSQSSTAVSRKLACNDESSWLQQQLQLHLKQAFAAEDKWMVLAQKADNTRMLQGGTPFADHEAMLEGWKDADREVVRAQLKLQQLHDEKHCAQKLERSWDLTNRRLQVLRTVHSLSEQSQQFEQDLVGAVSSEERRLAQLSLEDVQRKLRDTNQAWMVMAEDYLSQNTADTSPTDTAPTSAHSTREHHMEHLKESDEAVLHRWQQLHDSAIDVESFHRMQHEFLYTLQLDVFLNGQEDACFQHCRTLEEGAQAYRRCIRTEARRAAKENIPGAGIAWESRLRQIELQIQEWEAKKLSSADATATSKVESSMIADLLPRLRIMESCEKNAYSQFVKEKKRLDGIELLWRRIEQQRMEREQQVCKEAAKLFWQGDVAAWRDLSDEQRHRFNASLEAQNREYRQLMIQEENELEDIEIRLQEERVQLAKRQSDMLRLDKETKEAIGALHGDAHLYLQKVECWKRKRDEFATRTSMLEMADWSQRQLQELVAQQTAASPRHRVVSGDDLVWQLRGDNGDVQAQVQVMLQMSPTHGKQASQQTSPAPGLQREHFPTKDRIHIDQEDVPEGSDEDEEEDLDQFDSSDKHGRPAAQRSAAVLFSSLVERLVGPAHPLPVLGWLELTADSLFFADVEHADMPVQIRAEDVLEIVVGRQQHRNDCIVDVFTKLRTQYRFNLLEAVVAKNFGSLFRSKMRHADVIKVTTQLRQNKADITEAWCRGSVSTFEYLLWLNRAARRSSNDVHQYPIFPWVIADYTSPVLNLSNPATFRDFLFPIGMQTSESRDKMQATRVDSDGSDYCFCTKMCSTKQSVVNYLQRLLLPDAAKSGTQTEAFNSMQQMWESCISQTDQAVELTPEFFYQPELFQSIPGLPDFELPPWAKNATDFIFKQRLALESAFVRAHLHAWIDFMFGYRQQMFEGSPLYPVTCYEADSSLTEECGVVPVQLFEKPHPQSIPNDRIDVVFSLIAPSVLTSHANERYSKPPKISSLTRQALSTEPIVFLKSTHMDHSATGALVSIDAAGIAGCHWWSANALDAAPIVKLRLDHTANNQALNVETPARFFLPFSSPEKSKVLPIPTNVCHNRCTVKNTQFSTEKQAMLKSVFENKTFRAESTRQYHRECISNYREDNVPCPQYAVFDSLNLLVTCGHWDHSFAVHAMQAARHSIKCTQSIRHHSNLVTCICTAEDHELDYWVICGSSDRTVSVWKLLADLRTVPDTPEHVLTGHADMVTCVAANPSLDVVVSGDNSGLILVCQLRSGAFLMGLLPQGNILTELAPPPMPTPLHTTNSGNDKQGKIKSHVTWLGVSSRGFIIAYEAAMFRLTAYTTTGRVVAQIMVLEKLHALLISENGDVLVTGGTGGLVVFRWAHNLKLADNGYRRLFQTVFDGQTADTEKFQATITSLALIRSEFVLLVGLENGKLAMFTPETDYLRERLLRRHKELGIL